MDNNIAVQNKKREEIYRNLKTSFTAEQARELTENSTFLIRNVHKWIKEASERNSNYFNICSDEFDPKCFENLKSVLLEEGFTLSTNSMGNVLKIEW